MAARPSGRQLLLHHSLRSAVTGSTLDAREAGMQAAATCRKRRGSVRLEAMSAAYRRRNGAPGFEVLVALSTFTHSSEHAHGPSGQNCRVMACT